MKPPSDQLHALALIEPFCEEFEDALQAGPGVAIESYLDRVDEEHRVTLLEELLALDLHFQRKRGAAPDLANYLRRFPDYAETILRVMAPTSGSEPGRIPDIAALKEGTVLEPYTIKSELGRGGMGIVYRAKHRHLDRTVALKLLPQHAQQTEQAKARFQREAKAIAKLHHARIVPVFDFGEIEGSHYFAMQLIEGESLAQAIQRRRDTGFDPLHRGNLRLLVSQAMEIARALQFAHDRGVIHRDVKPSNILLDLDGSPWLVDFGVARVEESDLTTPEDLLGTLRYMPPERFHGHSGPSDDVYALGVTLFEAIALQPVFKETDPAVLMHHIVHHRPPKLREVLRHAPRDLETVVATAMANEADLRYHTAGDLADDLQRFLDELPVVARPIGPLERTWRWSRRNRPAAAILALLGVLALTGTGISAVLNQRNHTITQLSDDVNGLLDASEAARRSLRSELYRSNLQTAAQGIFRDQGSHVRELLEKWIPAERETDLRGWEWYMLRSAVALDEGLVQYGERAGSAVAWCPATRRFAVGGSGGVRILDADSRGTVQEIGGFSYTRSLQFSADGSRLLVSAMDGLRVIALPSAKVLAFHANREFNQARWLDGDSTALVMTPMPHVWHVADSSLEPLSGWSYPSRAMAVSSDGLMVAGASGASELQIQRRRDGVVLRAIDTSKAMRRGLHDNLRFSPNGELLAGSDGKGGLHVWRVDTGKTVFVRPADSPSLISFLDWSADSQRLVTSTNKAQIRIWDAETGVILRTQRGHRGDVRGAIFADQDRLLVTTSQHKDLRFWDLTQQPGKITLPSGAGTGSHRTLRLQWTQGGRGLRLHGARTYADWDLSGPLPELAETGPYDYSLPSPDGSMELKVTPAQLQLIDRATGEDLFAALSGGAFESPIKANRRSRYRWSPDAERIYVGHRGPIRVIGDLRGHLPTQEVAQGEPFRALDLDPSGRYLAATGGAPLIIFDAVTLEEIARPEPITGAGYPEATDLAFGPQGAPLALSRGAEIWLFDSSTFAPLRSLSSFSESIIYLAWSPDGSRIAASTHGGGVSLFSPDAGLMVSLPCPGEITDLAWSPDGTQLAALDSEGKWHLWSSQIAEEFEYER